MPSLADLRVSVALIARNEAACIARCLDSTQGLDCEKIVVDTGSTDDTRSIARQCGAKILEFPWCDDFSAARNVGLDAAQSPWILVLDADEYLPPASIPEIREIISRQADRAYSLLNKSSRDGGQTGQIGKIVRLFPNRPEIRFEWPIHEQVVSSLQRAGLPIHDTSIEIIHTGYSSNEIIKGKQERNLRILEKTTAYDPSPHPMVLFLLGGALLDLGRISEALVVYERCMANCDLGGELFYGARVRMCTCLALLKRPGDILALAPAEPIPSWHPEMLCLVGEALIETGRFLDGIQLLEGCLSSVNRTRIPAYDPVRIKARCVMAIANSFEKNDRQLALALLKLAAASIQQGHEIMPNEVASLLKAR